MIVDNDVNILFTSMVPGSYTETRWKKLSFTAEAICTTVVLISGVIRTTVVPLSGVIGPTVVRIANSTGIGYRHDGSIRFSNKLTYAVNS